MPTKEDTDRGALPGASIEDHVIRVGEGLLTSLTAVLDELTGGSTGPAELGRQLGVDKVLASRVLKALRNRDPVAVVYLVPGPEPLRRVLKAAGRRGVDARTIARADQAVTAFEELIRRDAGDRSGLDAMLSAWLPEARAEFELRRKQSAYKAMSHLRGVTANTSVATVIVHPSADGAHHDVVWITGLLGLRRLRPGATVKFATRRFADGDGPRRPTSLDRVDVDDLTDVRLDAFCSDPLPEIQVVRAGEVVHYVLGRGGFGPRSEVDVLFAEANIAELQRYLPAGERRKSYFFAEVSTPVKVLHFDVLVHVDAYPGSDPGLVIYDTVLDGVASVNDPGRNIDRLDLAESILPLGVGVGRFRSADVPRYAELVGMVCDKMGWDGTALRGYRCRSDYPVYGSQVVMTFDPEVRG
ncbi:MAG: hypothetical protein ACYTGC_13605 [Planctomycetota bacterium]|jgi:hypothetical protein